MGTSGSNRRWQCVSQYFVKALKTRRRLIPLGPILSEEISLQIYENIIFIVLGISWESNLIIYLAAHCCRSKDHAKVIFADVDKNRKDDGEFEEIISKERILINEDYWNTKDGSPYNHDVCILETTSDIIEPRNEYCQRHLCTAAPCFPHSAFIPGSKCFVAGWGNRRFRGRDSTNTLLQAGLNSFSNEYCLNKSIKRHYA